MQIIAKQSLAFLGTTIAIIVGGSTLPSYAANLTFYDNKADFLADTNALQSSPWAASGENLTAFTHDNLTFTPTSGNLLSSRFSGIAVNGVEDINVDIANRIYSFGFELREISSVSRHVESTFSISLFSEGELLTSFDDFQPANFETPGGKDAFWGVFSDVSFDRVEVRETVGGIDDESYRTFYTGTVAKSVPEPSLIFGLLGTLAFGFSYLKQKL